jgi:uncharacterized membrane protein
MRNIFFQKHPGLVIGGLVGLLIGLIFLVFDFWKMLIFVVLVTLGIFIGYVLDSDGRFKEQINKFGRRDSDN